MMASGDFVLISPFLRSANVDCIDLVAVSRVIVVVGFFEALEGPAVRSPTAYVPRTRNSGPVISALFGWQSETSARTKQ
jgi:hypothetical protein